MEHPIDKLNPRVAIALSGEFRVPTDPIQGRSHTLARLCWAATEKGELKSNSGFMWTYEPNWMPGLVSVSLGEHPYYGISFYEPGNNQVSAFVRRSDPTGNAITLVVSNEFSTILKLDTTRNIFKASSTIASTMEGYLSRFEGWTCASDGLWVPPSPEVDQPTVES
ncbi:MAG: hypothetical protein QG623_242 [Patescibacteria group bacterium]|nr:hypothetical protein [Patescibacteria group bacterium]